MPIDVAFVQYEFFGDLFVTETIQEETRAPVFNYSFVHRLDAVTEEFLLWSVSSDRRHKDGNRPCRLK